MGRISDQKVHFAPLERQKKAIDRLLAQDRFRNVSHFMRSAIDHYLDNLGRPPLSVQAHQMAEEFTDAGVAAERKAVYELQSDSMNTDEDW
jgi:Arc/MetJ-type ribon-helix-helix transcriptional regulator